MIVYTAITGGHDVLREEQNTDAKLVAFRDEYQESDVWQVVKACDLFQDPRRNARIHKALPHLYFHTEYSLWMDGTVKLLQPVQKLVDMFLKDADICLFQHHTRDCVYEEGDLCARLGYDDQAVLDRQLEFYRDKGYPEHNGLFETGVILRRHTPEIARLNEAWWAHISAFSKRDQVSLPFVLRELGIKYNLFNGTVKDTDKEAGGPRIGNDYFEYGGHAK